MCSVARQVGRLMTMISPVNRILVKVCRPKFVFANRWGGVGSVWAGPGDGRVLVHGLGNCEPSMYAKFHQVCIKNGGVMARYVSQ
jgi:hypothetical protein